MTAALRIALVCAAAAAVAWLGVGLRAARLEASGATVAKAPPGRLAPPRVQRALRDLRAADDHTPHRDPAWLRARLLARTGHRAQAAAILRRLVEEEPENAVYQLELARTARGNEAARARARLRELNPIGTPG